MRSLILLITLCAITPAFAAVAPEKSSWYDWCIEQGRPAQTCKSDAHAVFTTMRGTLKQLDAVESELLPVYEADALETQRNIIACKLACFESSYSRNCTTQCD